ncbi:hypothetical protein [Photobacterium leiognathi]|uniref:hypothetical protein n=1 Tax=Photobacterium leiognathi TaxID=553611 RepID=UPI000769CA91|nr:hypothetical protein [Photobacterium leiognathi]
MKLGPVEGTPEEVNNFFQNNGLNPLDYFEKPEKQLSKVWLILPCVIFVVCLSVLSFVGELTEKVKLFIFLIGFGAGAWAAVCVHIRFKSAWGAGSIILASLLIMLVAFGVLQPAQLLEHIKVEK